MAQQKPKATEYRVRLSDNGRRFLIKTLNFWIGRHPADHPDTDQAYKLHFRLKRLPYITNKEVPNGPELEHATQPEENPLDH